MDEIDNNKQKTIFGKLKSSISDIFPAALSKTGATSSFYKADCEVDIDSVEEESSNHDNRNFKVNREFRKLENQRNLKRKLADLKSKNQYNDEFSFRPKFQNHNASLKDDVVINESLISTDSQESIKLKTNYRTLCDFEIRKPVECVSSPHYPLNNSGFLSMSRQSLNDSVNETGISSTASRIAANILNKSNSQKTGIIHKTSSNSSFNSFSMRTRRYRTIIKQDKFSSYLTRVPKEDNLFNSPNLGTSNVVLNLNCSEDSTKRVDFSYAHIIQDQHNKVKESIDSNIYWTCVNCNSSNPSNFNFCPTCSTSNPKLVLKEKNFKPLIDENKNIWVCSRCSTRNDECRIVCIFCFKNKNISTKRPKLDENIDEKCLNSKMNPTEKFNFTDCANMDFNFESSNTTNNVGKSFKSSDSEREAFVSCNPECSPNNGSCNSQLPQPKFIFGSSSCQNDKEEANENKCKRKWNCSVCLAENEWEWGKCACCTATNPNKEECQQPKSNFLFGSSNLSTENPAIKFGSSGIVVDKSRSAFVFGESQPTKFVFGKPDLSGVAAGTKWNCSDCWAENEAEREKCACCSSRRPISSPAGSDADKSTIAFGSAKNDSIPPQHSIAFGQSGHAGQEEPLDQPGAASSEKKWNCSECWVENGADKEKCVCCAARNPAGPKRDSSAAKVQFGSLSSGFALGTASKWNCSDCWAENEPEREKCACCGCRNPSGAPLEPSLPSTPAARAPGPAFMFNGSSNTESRPQTVPFRFGTNGNAGNAGTKLSVSPALQNGTGKSPPAKWGCPTCLVENAEALDSCACCQTRNPRNAPKVAQVPIFQYCRKRPSSSSPPPPPTFKFGCGAEVSPNPEEIDTRKQTENGCDDPKLVTLSSNLFDPDCLVKFVFSPPHSLPESASAQVPVDLTFEFSAPQFLR